MNWRERELSEAVTILANRLDLPVDELKDTLVALGAQWWTARAEHAAEREGVTVEVRHYSQALRELTEDG